MSEITFRCQYCHRVHTAPAEAAGSELQCLCGRTNVVPEGDTELAEPAGNAGLGSVVAGESVHPGPAAPETSGIPGEEIFREVEAVLDVGAIGGDDGEVEEKSVRGGRAFPDGSDALEEECRPTEILPSEGGSFLAGAPSPDLEPGSDPESPPDEATEFEEALEFEPEEVLTGGLPSTVSAGRQDKHRRGQSKMGKGYFIAAAVACLIWIIHTSPWIYLGIGPDFLQKPLPEVVGLVDHTHYLSFERAFWSALLAGLVLCLGGEGLMRSRRQREESFADF